MKLNQQKKENKKLKELLERQKDEKVDLKNALEKQKDEINTLRMQMLRDEDPIDPTVHPEQENRPAHDLQHIDHEKQDLLIGDSIIRDIERNSVTIGGVKIDDIATYLYNLAQTVMRKLQ